MARLLEFLWIETWTYHPGDRSWFAIGYHAFNLFEGAAWFVFGVLVLRRYLIHCHSRLEVAYAATFFVFGLTDFREAFSMPLWLLGVKLFNLIGLLWLRRIVMRRFYPQCKVY
jgi:hypothetical protein